MLIISMDLELFPLFGYGSGSSDAPLLLERVSNMGSGHNIPPLSFFALTHNPCSQN